MAESGAGPLSDPMGESSYRMRNVFKPKTSSKKATIRYFYSLISFLLKKYGYTFRKNILQSLREGLKL